MVVVELEEEKVGLYRKVNIRGMVLELKAIYKGKEKQKRKR